MNAPPTPPALDVRWLGRVPYADALALQDELVAARRAGTAPDTVLLLEHDPVFTIGRTRDRSSLREAADLPFPLVETNRGGKATYHGPGQLVGYPILDLTTRGQDLHHHLRTIEDALVAFLLHHGVADAARQPDLTGVWAGPRKIASIGIGVRRWVTMHGFALNVTAESLTPFQSITPCGIPDVEITCLNNEPGTPPLTVAQAAGAARPFLEVAFNPRPARDG